MVIHYIYKICFLCGEPGRYYLGKRTYYGKDIKYDKYTGSGTFPKEYFKQYGQHKGVTYTKEIIETNETYDKNRLREIEIIGDLWQTDPLCMNRQPGGDCHELNKRAVKQYDLDGNLIAEYESEAIAQSETGTTNISACCLGKNDYKTVGGFIWRFAEDPFNKYPIPNKRFEHKYLQKKINQYTLKGKYIKTWDSIADAAREYGKNEYDAGNLSDNLRGKRRNSWKGFVWRFYEGDTNDIIVKERVKHIYKVKQYDLDGNFIAEYNSLRKAAKAVGSSYPDGIKRCAEGKQESSAGYIWKFNMKYD